MTRQAEGTGGVSLIRARLIDPESREAMVRTVLWAYEQSWEEHEGASGPQEGYSLARTAGLLGMGVRTLTRMLRDFPMLGEAIRNARNTHRDIKARS